MKYLKRYKIFEYKKSLQINSYDELLSLLKEYNVPLNIWGTYGYKTVNHLWEEIKEEECVLSIVNNEIHRNVQYIGAKIIYEKDGVKYKLCEDRAEFKDGRIRIRGGMIHSVAEKFKAGEDPTKALIRGLKEELGVNVHKNQFIYYNKENIENNEDYPGIKSFHTGYLYFIKFNDGQFKPQYVEYQKDKTIYFVWRKVEKRHAGYYPLPLGGDAVTFESVENKDIVITIPSYIKWNDYEKELDKVKDGKEVLNFKVNHLPKKTNIGNKCYMVYNGEIIGWMKIVGLTENEFVCTTTGKKWKGKFIQRSGEFHRIDPIPYKGFQGFRYI